MKKIMMFMVLLLMPMVFSASTKTCIDSDTLEISKNQTITIDGIPEVVELLEEVHCPAGCVNGECKPIKSSMPIEIYIFLCVVAIGTMFISFFKEDILLFKWIAVIILAMLGASSFNLNRIYCEHTSSGWDCFVHQYTATNLAYLWFGLGAIMLVYAIITTIQAPAKEIARQV